MFKINYNPVSKRWHERVSSLPQEKQDLITAPIRENFLVLKKSKEPVKEGDVFVVSPKESIYFFGKVLVANIQSIKGDSEWNGTGSHVVCVFKCKSKAKEIREFKADYDNLLVNPVVITSAYWKKGWIETIGNIPLTEVEKNLDYGFYSEDWIGPEGAFYKANGEVLNHMPKLYESRGITTFIGLYMDVKTELIIDPSLLE